MSLESLIDSSIADAQHWQQRVDFTRSGLPAEAKLLNRVPKFVER
jgi:hypothetical protein